MKPKRQPTPTRTKTKNAKKRIFIVYQDHEKAIVQKLDALLTIWGFRSFYCRNEVRNAPGGEYRDILRKELAGADLVLLLLSPSFRWSEYCQSEAGATATMDIRHIPILIPPIGNDDVKTVAPVLKGEGMMKAVDPDHPHNFGKHLKDLIAVKLGIASEGHPDDSSLLNELEEELARCIRQYELNAPKTLMRVWPSIEDRQAARSLVEHLKRSLASREDSKFSLVGVSLKFSLLRLNDALEEYAAQHKSPKHSGKKLTVELVHMDDHAHILQALEDEVDKGEIRLRMSLNWPAMNERWKEIGEQCGISITVQKHVIDYIPPRVGILIDEKLLYAGRCSVQNVATTESFNLLVGEKPYFQYGSSSDGDDERIREFKEMLKLYQRRKFNGALLCGEDLWLKHFEDAIHHSPSLEKLIIVSSAAANSRKLIPLALKKTKATVEVFVQNPKRITRKNRKQAIESLTTDFRNELVRDELDVSRVSVYYYETPPTFRAVLLEGLMAGVSCYSFAPQIEQVGAEAEWELAKANPVNIVVTRHAPHYDVIVGDFIMKFIASAKAAPAFKGGRARMNDRKQ